MPDGELRIVRSPRRRRIAFRIAGDGVLEILAPPTLSETYLRRVAGNNQALIDKLKKRATPRRAPVFSEGSPFMLLGTPYPLHLTGRLRIFDGAFMIPAGTEEEMTRSIILLYKELAGGFIRRTLPIYEELTGASPLNVRITSANSRWGSCTAGRTISFSWKLIQCPREAVEYVIVHELCHLRELNHSADFWRHVAKIFPDYRERRSLLNRFGETLPEWNTPR